jgi:hypothetical protein
MCETVPGADSLRLLRMDPSGVFYLLFIPFHERAEKGVDN